MSHYEIERSTDGVSFNKNGRSVVLHLKQFWFRKGLFFLKRRGLLIMALFLLFRKNKMRNSSVVVDYWRAS